VGTLWLALDPATDLRAVHRHAPARWPVLFESVSGGAQGRFDLLLHASGEVLRLQRDGGLRHADGRVTSERFLDALDMLWRALPRADADADAASSAGLPAEAPRFRGGFALLLGYELAVEIEPVLRLPAAEGGLPVAAALRCPAALLRDRESGRAWLVTEPGADALLPGLHAEVAAAMAMATDLPPWQSPAQIEEDPPRRYLDAVAEALQRIAAGDVFQVNLARGWRVRFAQAPAAAALHERLAHANPAPFAGLFVLAEGAVVSASPERLLRLREGVADTRPIAGTRPRLPGDDDAARREELLAHPKERAEHVMLVDLERNDLGRICAPGSVQVDEWMSIESYAHVHHIVSNVRGRLRAGVTPGQAIAAVFPGGTITGCPKVQCMRTIAALEGTGRGAYTGAMGWLDASGDMDLNILIRSAELEGDTLRFRTGAGIVADSVPARELDETRAKARGMLRALGLESAP
jgi:anthranilate synthase component 1